MLDYRTFLKRLRRNESGNVGLLFAVSLIPMVTAGGVAIDYSRTSQAYTRLQSALDAGVLAAAKNVTITDNEVLRQQVETVVRANTEGRFTSPATVTLQPSSDIKLSIKARGCLQLAFRGFTGTVDPCVEVRTDAAKPTENYVEIALVLDNSGSMGGSKIVALRDAATGFVNNLFTDVSNPEKVKISVVPFTLTVNAGAGMNINSDPNLDRFGQSSIHWENLLPPATTPPAWAQSRFSLYQTLGETWTGCFEMRPGAWGLNDNAPTPGIGDSLFVPMFAPDEPGNMAVGSVRQNTLNANNGGSTFNIRNSYLNDDGSSSINYSSGIESSATNAACTPTATAFALPFSSPTASWQTKNFNYRSTANICRYNLTGTATGSASGRKSITNMGSDPNGAGRGPNYFCNAKPILRLTNSKPNLLTKISQMEANGNTNILEGLMWGWRTVSPNAPYANGRPYNWTSGTIRNRKYIILMTDGDNYWAAADNPNGSMYSPFGYFKNNRLGTGLVTDNDANARMNEKTLQACNNVKLLRDAANNEAIKIITIGFSTPGQEISPVGLSLLQNCASMEGAQRLFYTATNATQLNEVFSLIAKNIGKLQITH
jgi:Flp pilus assembly protein TadG